jgi:hypothetical protein
MIGYWEETAAALQISKDARSTFLMKIIEALLEHTFEIHVGLLQPRLASYATQRIIRPSGRVPSRLL